MLYFSVSQFSEVSIHYFHNSETIFYNSFSISHREPVIYFVILANFLKAIHFEFKYVLWE